MACYRLGLDDISIAVRAIYSELQLTHQVSADFDCNLNE